MKKLLYIVTHSKLGGAQRYFLDLAKNLKNEYEITVAFGGRPDQGELGSLLDKMGVKYVVIPHLNRNINPILGVRSYFEIKKLILELRPNIIHVSSFKASFITSLAVRRIRNQFKPFLVYTAHGWAFTRFKNPLKNKYFYFAINLIMKLLNQF